MKQIQTIEKGANFNAADFGRLADIKDYVLELGPDVKIPGKVFGGQAVGATGGDFSFQVFGPAGKPDSSTPTRPMKSSTSSFREKANSRSTGAFSPSVKEASSVSLPRADAPCETTAASRW